MDTTSGFVIRSLFDGLMRLGPNGLEPAIASEVTVSPNKRIYTFKLRDALWTNGDPVTAQDFEYAWKCILNPQNPSEIAYKLYVIKNAQKVKEGKLPLSDLGFHTEDPKTLVVELEYPDPYFLEMTALSHFYPVNQHVDERNPHWYDKAGKDFVTNGPFMMKDWEHSEPDHSCKKPNLLGPSECQIRKDSSQYGGGSKYRIRYV